MYNEVIKMLIRKLGAIPEILVIKYLMVVYETTENMAKQSIHSAYRSRIAYPSKKGYMMRYPNMNITSAHEKKAKSLSVAISLAKGKQSDFEFNCTDYPWQIRFTINANQEGNSGNCLLVQICCINRNMEHVDSMLIAGTPVAMEDRAFIKRIAVVDEDASTELIKKAGFTLICSVNENYKVDIIEKRSGLSAWSDVPESR